MNEYLLRNYFCALILFFVVLSTATCFGPLDHHHVVNISFVSEIIELYNGYLIFWIYFYPTCHALILLLLNF
jgi:hypothetical protein